MAVKLPGLCLLLLVLLGLSWAWKHPCPIFAKSCDECIQSGPECGWCAEYPYTHCDTQEYLHRSGCRDPYIYNPQSSLQILQNHSSSHTEDGSSLFLQPQQVSLHLRPAVSQSFILTISMPTDQPITELTLETNERRCRRDETEALCSGSGTCVEGGTCECNKRPNPAERYSGAFCECSNFDCPYHNNSICGGNGRCECDECICDPQWTGESCGCTTNITSCLAKKPASV